MSEQDGRDLTLYEIGFEMREVRALLDAAGEATTDAERDAITGALTQYMEAEVRKVDNLFRFVRNEEAVIAAKKNEAQRLSESARLHQSRIDRLKLYVLGVMEALGYKKLEGRLGALSVRGNGGQLPLVVDESILPDRYRETIVHMSLEDWRFMLAAAREKAHNDGWTGSTKPTGGGPFDAAIRAALERGEDVPGARLEERGKHLRIS